MRNIFMLLGVLLGLLFGLVGFSIFFAFGWVLFESTFLLYKENISTPVHLLLALVVLRVFGKIWVSVGNKIYK